MRKPFIKNFLRIFSDARFNALGLFAFWEELLFGSDQSVGDSSIAPYQFETAKRVAHGTDLAHLIGVNGGNWNGFDPGLAMISTSVS